MPKKKPLPPREELEKMWAYDPQTGVFRHKITYGSKKKGEIAGTDGTNRYVCLRYKGKLLAAHRVAWLFVYGEDPCDVFIDHINGDCYDNSIKNLRLCNVQQNACNQSLSAKNKTGVKGVSWCSKTKQYKGAVTFNRKYYFAGRFDELQQAIDAVRSLRNQLHGDFYTHRGDATIEPQQLDLWQTSRPKSSKKSD